MDLAELIHQPQILEAICLNLTVQEADQLRQALNSEVLNCRVPVHDYTRSHVLRILFINRVDQETVNLASDIERMGSGDVMIDAVEQNDYDRVKLLLDIGVSPDVDDEYGDPSISMATKKQHIDIVKLLVERGADVDQKDVLQETALMHAVWKKSPELVKFLLEAGANVHLTDYNRVSVVDIAQALNNQEIIDLIQASLHQ